VQVDLEGGCLCGAVRYRYVGELGGALGAVTECHCVQCRKVQGGAAAVAPIQAAGLAFSQGEDQIAVYESSPGKQRAFCRHCASPLYSRRMSDRSVMRLRLGSIDNPPPDLRVEAHTFIAGAPAWDQPDPAVPRYPGLEPGRG
jgi:hypothetical protein